MRRLLILLIAAVSLVAIPAGTSAERGRSDRVGMVISRNLRYGVAGGEPLLLDAYLVAGQRARPAVVFVHGGGFRAGDKAFLAPGEQSVAEIAAPLTRRGFLVFSINYRLAPRFRFPAAERDILTALVWVRRHACALGVDPARLALFGASAGGDLVALAALGPDGPLDRGQRVRAVVSWSGPMDLAAFYIGHSFVSDYLGCVPSVCPRRYRDASPVSHVDHSDPPVLLANGSAELVPLSQAQKLARVLQAARVPHELVVVRGSRHAGQYQAQVWRPTVRFLEQHLR